MSILHLSPHPTSQQHLSSSSSSSSSSSASMGCQVLKENTETKQTVVFTKPFSLEAEKEGNTSYTAPNFLHRILTLFKNVRPGSDLAGFQLPPVFNIPKSQLQCYGETVYCFAGDDFLSKSNAGETPIQRFKSVIAWTISTSRPLIFGVSPYNPILGETHHVSRGHLNVLLEQVSHHPPVSALHATNEKDNIEMIWWQQAIPKFCGASVETQVKGKRQLKLKRHGETYEMNSPNLLIKFLPVSSVDWVGKVCIKCLENGLQAELHYKSGSFMGFRGNNRSINGKIFESSSMRPLFEISGHWDRLVTAKDVKKGKVEVLFDATKALSGLKAPTVKEYKEVWPSESAVVWGEVSRALLRQDWEGAAKAKKAVEDKQRDYLSEIQSSHRPWSPKHFTVVRSTGKNGENWECSPLQAPVPRAPIEVPL